MIKKILRFLALLFLSAAFCTAVLLHFVPFEKTPLVLFRYWRYQKLAENFMRLYWENFITSEMTYTGNFIYAGTTEGISVFDARDEKNIRLVKKVPLYGRVGHITVEGNILYATSGASGFYTLDISFPENPRVTGNVNLFRQNYVEDGAVKNGMVYLSTDRGIVVVDAKNPRKPRVVSHVDEPQLMWVHVNANTLYVAKAAYGMLIYDISRAEKPVLLSKLKLYEPQKNKPVPVDEPPRWVTTVNNYAYLANGYQGISILDVHDAHHPVFIKHFKTGAFCDQIAVFGQILAVRALPQTILFLDVSSPENPVIVKSMRGIGFPHQGVRGNKAVFVTSRAGFRIADITNPLAPKILGTYIHPPVASDIQIYGNYIFLADGSGGLEMYKIMKPGEVKKLSTLQTTGLANSLAVSFPYVFIANGLAGVDVVDVWDAENPVLKTTFNAEQHNWGVALQNNLLYIAAGTMGMTVYDVRDPLHPRFVSGLKRGLVLADEIKNDYMFHAGASPPYVFLSGFMGSTGVLDMREKNLYRFVPLRMPVPQVCSVASRGNIFYFGYNGGIQVAASDTAGAFKPVFHIRTGGIVFSLDVDGNRLYATDYENGILAFDISNPARPQEVTRYHTTIRKPRGIAVKDNVAYVAAGEDGLLILDLAKGQTL